MHYSAVLGTVDNLSDSTLSPAKCECMFCVSFSGRDLGELYEAAETEGWF